MMLVDTSVWIDLFRSAQTPQTIRLASAIEEGQDIYICGVILTEILQGIRLETDYAATRDVLLDILYLPIPKDCYLLAADIYRRARRGSFTIRNTVDCVIAACSICNNVPLLQNDRDFEVIARFSDLKLEHG